MENSRAKETEKRKIQEAGLERSMVNLVTRLMKVLEQNKACNLKVDLIELATYEIQKL